MNKVIQIKLHLVDTFQWRSKYNFQVCLSSWRPTHRVGRRHLSSPWASRHLEERPETFDHWHFRISSGSSLDLIYWSSIYCRPAGRVYSKKKGYFRDEGEGATFPADQAGQVDDSSCRPDDNIYYYWGAKIRTSTIPGTQSRLYP